MRTMTSCVYMRTGGFSPALDGEVRSECKVARIHVSLLVIEGVVLRSIQPGPTIKAKVMNLPLLGGQAQ